jgi:hypothetical protein
MIQRYELTEQGSLREAENGWWMMASHVEAELAEKDAEIASLTAALALLPGEPDGWIWEDEFTCEREVYETWVEAGRKPTAFYFSPAAAPAAPPVAVKARPSYDQVIDVVLKNLRRMRDAGESHRMAARWISEDLDKLYVASPVGGTEEEPKPPVEPYGYAFQHEETGLTQVVDVQQVEWGFEKNNPRWQKVGAVYLHAPISSGELEDYDAGLLNDFGGGNVEWWHDYLRAEIGRANDFWREQIHGLRSSPTPASDIAALREENGILSEALKRMENCYEQLAATRTHEIYTAMIDGGQADALLDLDNARRNARSALQHVAKGERG